MSTRNSSIISERKKSDGARIKLALSSNSFKSKISVLPNNHCSYLYMIWQEEELMTHSKVSILLIESISLRTE